MASSFCLEAIDMENPRRSARPALKNTAPAGRQVPGKIGCFLPLYLRFGLTFSPHPHRRGEVFVFINVDSNHIIYYGCGKSTTEVIRSMSDRIKKAAPLRKPRTEKEKPISNSYPEIDNDLARDNLENDIPAADLEDI